MWNDICTINSQVEDFQKCQTGLSPLDFIYELRSNSYNLMQYRTDADLLAKVQTGKGDDALFEGF
jgi:hypothetical protein